MIGAPIKPLSADKTLPTLSCAGLAAALTAGVIKGAGLDVFADEPNIPSALLAMDNAVLLPHVGSATRETRQAMGDLCKANLDAWFKDKKVLTLIPELS